MNSSRPASRFSGSRLPETPDLICARRKRIYKPKALVVDDDPYIHPVVKLALDVYGISTKSVNNGARCMAELRNHRYDLLILDLGMEGRNGFNVLQTLNTETRLRELRVMVLTADNTPYALARSLGYGADDFVVKPVILNDFGMRAYNLLGPLPRQQVWSS